MAWAAVRSKVVVLLLLIHCFMFLPLCVGSGFHPCFVMLYFSGPILFCNRLDQEERAGCFNCLPDVLLLSVF